MLPEYEHVYQQYLEELVRIEDSTKDIALQLDQQSLLGMGSEILLTLVHLAFPMRNDLKLVV